MRREDEIPALDRRADQRVQPVGVDHQQRGTLRHQPPHQLDRLRVRSQSRSERHDVFAVDRHQSPARDGAALGLR